MPATAFSERNRKSDVYYQFVDEGYALQSQQFGNEDVLKIPSTVNDGMDNHFLCLNFVHNTIEPLNYFPIQFNSLVV
nr:hypothetical protein [uncultured Fibrobacter sp.]